MKHAQRYTENGFRFEDESFRQSKRVNGKQELSLTICIDRD